MKVGPRVDYVAEIKRFGVCECVNSKQGDYFRNVIFFPKALVYQLAID